MGIAFRELQRCNGATRKIVTILVHSYPVLPSSINKGMNNSSTPSS